MGACFASWKKQPPAPHPLQDSALSLDIAEIDPCEPHSPTRSPPPNLQWRPGHSPWTAHVTILNGPVTYPVLSCADIPPRVTQRLTPAVRKRSRTHLEGPITRSGQHHRVDIPPSGVTGSGTTGRAASTGRMNCGQRANTFGGHQIIHLLAAARPITPILASDYLWLRFESFVCGACSRLWFP